MRRLILVALCCAACSPVIRPAPFAGARDQVTDVNLLGPFDGQVIDVATSEPLQGATVVAVWSFDRGDGLIGPYGSQVLETKTDQAGRYRVPRPRVKVHGRHVRLVSFELVVYKRGYVGYRSDALYEGGGRHDFSLRHNKVELRKWREGDSHARHLLFLSAPVAVAQLSKWERESANLDLYQTLGGASKVVVSDPIGPLETNATATLELLDASALLLVSDIQLRTGYTDEFATKELQDLARTHFFHGVHLQATGHDETWDIGLRVWKDPPGGLALVQETFEATLPGVSASSEITAQTWVLDGNSVRAVGVLDPEQNVGFLLTCGASQCPDIETAIILAKLAHTRIAQLRLVKPGTPAQETPQ